MVSGQSAAKSSLSPMVVDDRALIAVADLALRLDDQYCSLSEI
jgi:hypothetical protein